jgi:hypothetical protein
MRSRALAVPLAGLVLAGCGGDDTVEGPAPKAPAGIRLTSPSYPQGRTLPRAVTCDGKGAAPALEWSGVPKGARSLAILMEDPDAPDGTFVHWTVWDLDPAAQTLLGAGPAEGENSFGDKGYGAPCPPEGDPPHRYRLILYALREPLGLEAGAKPADVREAIAGRALARGVLEARYGRQ